MDLYTDTAYQLSRQLTLRYSTSFGKSTLLFSKSIQPHIFAIYGLVRIADEIVDTYNGANKADLLANLEAETYEAISHQYSPNPIVHAFALTAAQFGITDELIRPFFESMRLDLKPQRYNKKLYNAYIYGSAEVIGLMCLHVFTEGDARAYAALEKGAKALGAAYQKVNVLRDIASDYHDRGRVYFPGVAFETFSDADKQSIIEEISQDFTTAKPTLQQLPVGARRAVTLSFQYYSELLRILRHTPAETLRSKRVRVPTYKKFLIGVTSARGHR